MEYTFNQGSIWRRWDLHVHTKGTNKNDQYKSRTFDDFCELLFKRALEFKIAAIGITDYFSVENYINAKKYQDNIQQRSQFSLEEQRRIKSILLIPNVELRMTPVTKPGKLINIHCLFNPSYLSFLDNDFFNALDFSIGGFKYKMNRQGFIDLGKRENSQYDEDKAYKFGVNNFIVSQEQLQSILSGNQRFRDNVIIVVSNSNSDGASGLQEHYKLFENEQDSSLDALRQAIYCLSDCVFSSNKNDRDFFLGLRTSQNDVIKRCGSLKPCIHGCDAHTEDKLFVPDNNRFCWIKSDVSFEGLKQIIYEPQERVVIDEHCPDEKIKYNIIEKIKLTDNNNKYFQNIEIGLNPNLNVIIGGKSSGKSLLLHMIAHQAGNPNAEMKNYSELMNNVKLDLFYADSPDEARKITDGRIIEFLPQLYIEKIIRDKQNGVNNGVNYFNKFIENLIKQEDYIKEIFDKYEDYIKNIESDISDKITLWIKLDTELTKAREELNTYGDENAITKAVKEKVEQKDSLNKSIGFSEEEKEYSFLTQKKTDIEKNIKQVDEIINELEMLRKWLVSDSTKKDIIEAFSVNIKNDEVLRLFKYFKDKLSDTIKSYISIFSISIDIEKKQRSSCIEKLKGQLLDCNSKLAPFELKNKNKIQIDKLDNEIRIEQEKIKRINDKKTEIRRISSERNNINFIDLYSQFLLKNKDVVNKINSFLDSKWDNSVVDLKLSSKQIFNVEMFDEIVTSIINIKSYLENQFENCGFKASNYTYDENTHLANIDRILTKCINDNNRFSNFKTGHNLEELLRAILKNCYRIDYDIVKGNDSLFNMSEGKKGIVILQLYLSLSKSDYPILIDQPEDNLDNRTVYKELNDYVRDCKKRRQIIMVTHNANLAVNTDAENIIVANQAGEDNKENKEYKFEYVNGSLECTSPYDSEEQGILYQQGIREHVCEILEGGTIAFKNRERKYHIK